MPIFTCEFLRSCWRLICLSWNLVASCKAYSHLSPDLSQRLSLAYHYRCFPSVLHRSHYSSSDGVIFSWVQLDLFKTLQTLKNIYAVCWIFLVLGKNTAGSFYFQRKVSLAAEESMNWLSFFFSLHKNDKR